MCYIWKHRRWISQSSASMFQHSSQLNTVWTWSIGPVLLLTATLPVSILSQWCHQSGANTSPMPLDRAQLCPTNCEVRIATLVSSRCAKILFEWSTPPLPPYSFTCSKLKYPKRRSLRGHSSNGKLKHFTFWSKSVRAHVGRKSVAAQYWRWGDERGRLFHTAHTGLLPHWLPHWSAAPSMSPSKMATDLWCDVLPWCSQAGVVLSLILNSVHPNGSALNWSS